MTYCHIQLFKNITVSGDTITLRLNDFLKEKQLRYLFSLKTFAVVLRRQGTGGHHYHTLSEQTEGAEACEG